MSFPLAFKAYLIAPSCLYAVYLYNAVAFPYVVLSSPRETKANSCSATRIFFAVRDLPVRRWPPTEITASTHFKISVFNLIFASPVALLSGNPSSPRIWSSQSPISIPGTLVTRLASSSAKLGITERGPSDPADSKSARRTCGPKCLIRESAMGSSGEGKRVLANKAICNQRQVQMRRNSRRKRWRL